MKKILIFSLCALFSFDGAFGMRSDESSNPESKSVSKHFCQSLPKVEVFPVDPRVMLEQLSLFRSIEEDEALNRQVSLEQFLPFRCTEEEEALKQRANDLIFRLLKSSKIHDINIDIVEERYNTDYRK